MGLRGGPPRYKTVQRRLKICELMLRGYITQDQLADQLGVSKNQINDDLKVLKTTWRQEMAQSFEEARETELFRLSLIEREAWEQWEKSKDNAIKITVKTGGDSGKEKTKYIEGRCGSTAYLNVILGCVEARRRLLGLDQADKIELRGQVVVAGMQQLQQAIENNGDYIEYRRQQLLLGGDYVASVPGDGGEQQEMDSIEAPYVIGRPAGTNGSGQAFGEATEMARRRNRL